MKGLNYLAGLKQWTGEGKFSLSPMRSVMQTLGNPQDCYKSIHVAGTNGKGSISATLASILGAAGFKTSLTTSPHLVRQNERIVIDGIPISDQVLSKSALKVAEAGDLSGVELSYFEAITASFFYESYLQNVDWAVVEVGLGGRLDATNVLKKPVVSVISTIGFDHCDLLGDSLSSIAQEKSGIIKEGSLVVCGDIQDKPLHVIRNKCRELGIEPALFGKDFSIERRGSQNFFRDDECEIEFSPALRGAHQLINAAVAIKAARLAGIAKNACVQGVSCVHWPGRLEFVEFGRGQVLFEAAHNEEGVRALREYLEETVLGPVFIGFGALKTKNWKGMIDLLSPVVTRWGILEPDSLMKTDASEIAAYLNTKGIRGEVFGTNYLGFIEKASSIVPHCTVLIAGSIYLIGAVKRELGLKEKQIWTRGNESNVG